MTKLYFGNTVTIATTLMILALLGFIGCSAAARADIQYWGAAEPSAACFRPCCVLLCRGAGRSGQDHSKRR